LETAGLPLAYAPEQPANFSLLYFLVRLMLTAKRAEFAELQPLRFGLLVLGLAIVLSLALSTLQSDDFAHFRSLSVAQKSESSSQNSEGWCGAMRRFLLLDSVF
jgi:heme/copper-type cytochrome/quinol oxidase subunit 1